MSTLARVAAWGCALLPVVVSCALASGSESPDPTQENTARHLLVQHFRAFLNDRDGEAFRGRVQAQLSEAELRRLARSGSIEARRAAVMALGAIGTWAANPTVAKALRDDDPIVRDLAESALWAIWCRADTPENNATLERIRARIAGGELVEATRDATELITRAPRFAEAYNQRAIAAFARGHFEESLADCQKTVELNPFHIGALSGMAQCQLRLGQTEQALQTFRRASELQPHNSSLQSIIAALETGQL